MHCAGLGVRSKMLIKWTDIRLGRRSALFVVPYLLVNLIRTTGVERGPFLPHDAL